MEEGDLSAPSCSEKQEATPPAPEGRVSRINADHKHRVVLTDLVATLLFSALCGCSAPLG